jgi:hypothetical protein
MIEAQSQPIYFRHISQLITDPQGRIGMNDL